MIVGTSSSTSRPQFCMFQSAPSLISWGNRNDKEALALLKVSIRPQPHQLGELYDQAADHFNKLFQSAPSLISWGNPQFSVCSLFTPGFNPPPASSAGGTNVLDRILMQYLVSIRPQPHQLGELMGEGYPH